MMDQNEMRRNQALIDARAKIFWGDPPVEAIKHLMGQGISYEEAVGLVTPMVEERNATLRGIGLRKTLIGSGLICVPIGTWIVSGGVGFLSVKILGVAVLVGIIGLWLLIRHIARFRFRSHQRDDAVDQQPETDNADKDGNA